MKRSISQAAGDFSAEEREAVYLAIFERRDVRKDSFPIKFRRQRFVLLAAHHVGFMQPWDFFIIQHEDTKHAVRNLFAQANDAAAWQYREEKSDLYRGPKVEGIQEAPVNICVTCTRERGAY